MAPSILTRKRDLIYLIFFTTHLPIMFLIDLYPLYPSVIHESLPFLTTIREFYIETYADRNFTDPPSWFRLYLLLEGLYHVPLSLWAIPALLRADARAPLHLLVFALEVAVTTVTCVADVLGWEGVGVDVKGGLMGLYGGYLALAVFMAVDMYGRVAAQVERLEMLEKGRKVA